MTMDTVALDPYFERIRWGGSTSPTLDTLTALVGAHVTSVPFENLDVLLKRPIRLDIPSLQNKLVRDRRGGYCYEHATLLGAVLDQLGFQATRHSARVTVVEPRTRSPRTHMFLTVALPEGTFVVDPGFGALAPTVPVPLSGAEARTAHATHTMVHDGAYRILRIVAGDKVIDAWATTLEPDIPVDFEMANHYTATHPGSAFTRILMMRSHTPGGMVTVMNRELSFLQGGERRTTQLADRAALRSVLVEHFGYDVEDVLRLHVPAIPDWT